MKRFMILAMSLIIAVAPAMGQTKKEVKAATKEAKKEAKLYKKQGYKMLETGLLENALQRHLVKKNTTDVFEIVGTAENKRSINLAKTTARTNAINEYAESAKSLVKGRIVNDLNDVNDVQIENLVAGYERLVLKEMNGEVRTSITLVKENKDGTYDVRLICLVDLESAHKANLRAMKQAMEEAELAREYGSKVSDWISEGFVSEIGK